MRGPKKIIVLGHTGFLGRSLCARLKSVFPGADVYGISRRKGRATDVRARALDIRNEKVVGALLRRVRPDWIFHAAGSPGNAAPIELFEGHLLSTSALLEAARTLRGKKPRIILTGSAAEYGAVGKKDLPVKESAPCRPINPYGVAKSAQTELGLLYARKNTDVLIARVFNLLGPGLDEKLALSSFIDQIVRIERSGKTGVLRVGDLSPKRDFVDVSETASALIAVAGRGHSGEIYNICSGESVSMRTLLRELLRRSQASIRVQTDSARLRPADIPEMRGCPRKTARDTGWTASMTAFESLSRMLKSRRERTGR